MWDALGGIGLAFPEKRPFQLLTGIVSRRAKYGLQFVRSSWKHLLAILGSFRPRAMGERFDFVKLKYMLIGSSLIR